MKHIKFKELDYMKMLKLWRVCAVVAIALALLFTVTGCGDDGGGGALGGNNNPSADDGYYKDSTGRDPSATNLGGTTVVVTLDGGTLVNYTRAVKIAKTYNSVLGSTSAGVTPVSSPAPTAPVKYYPAGTFTTSEAVGIVDPKDLSKAISGWINTATNAEFKLGQTPVTGDITISPKLVNAQTIKLDNNDGSGVILTYDNHPEGMGLPKEFLDDGERVLSPVSNKAFTGWYTASGGAGMPGVGKEWKAGDIPPAGQVTLYAGWLNGVAVKFDLNGWSLDDGSTSLPDAVVLDTDVGSARYISDPLTDALKAQASAEGLTFKGWYDDLEGDGLKWNFDTMQVPNTTNHGGGIKTLYAVFTIPVTININGGTAAATNPIPADPLDVPIANTKTINTLLGVKSGSPTMSGARLGDGTNNWYTFRSSATGPAGDFAHQGNLGNFDPVNFASPLSISTTDWKGGITIYARWQGSIQVDLASEVVASGGSFEYSGNNYNSQFWLDYGFVPYDLPAAYKASGVGYPVTKWYVGDDDGTGALTSTETPTVWWTPGSGAPPSITVQVRLYAVLDE